MKVLKVTENPDGSATIVYELSDFDRKVIKRHLKVKRLTKKRINQFVQKAITNGVYRDATELIEGGEKR